MKYLLFFIVATALSAGLTPLVRLLALRTGFVVAPRSDRWHSKPTPVLGGIAMVVPFVVTFMWAFGLDPRMLPLVIGAVLIFLLGLYDDLRGLTPQVKFVGQIAVTALLISMGTVVEIIPWPVISYPLTFLWIVGLTNAFNLIDNMDGLSAGIAAISSAALFAFSISAGEANLAVCAVVLAGTCVGFLFFNFNPARIFMGDCGSMFLGFCLAVLSISGTWKHASSLMVTLLVPVLVLGIPIFDTAFVTFMRKMGGRPISQGGRDHMSHRLVALGFSEKKTVLILYSLSAACALGALFLNRINPLAFAGLFLVFVLVLFYFCVYLGYAEQKNGGSLRPAGAGSSKQVRALFVNAQRFVEIFVDLILVVVAYFVAYIIRFENGLPDLQLSYFVRTLPIVVVVKIASFYYFGLYRTVWRHVGVRDFMNILKAVFVGSLLIVSIILMYARFEYFSRAVFIVDAMLCLILISGSHFCLRILREYLESQPLGGKRVLLIGAGDAGEMALREIRNNPGLKYKVVGFLDDDPFKQKRRIHDVRVLGTIADVGRVVQRTGAQEVFLAIPSASTDNRSRIKSFCEDQSVTCIEFGG